MSSFSVALRHSRRLSTAVSKAAAAATQKPPSIQESRKKLKTVEDPDEALKIYNSYISSVNNPSTWAGKVQEDTVRILAKSGRFSDIETLLESYKSSEHITQEYFISSLIRSYGAAGMFDNALNTYEQMPEFGTPRSVLSFNALLFACVQCKLFDIVIAYFDEFPAKFGFSPNKFSYGMLIKSYCEMGSPEIAIEKLNEMRDKGFELDAVVFTNIFRCLYGNGRTQEAEIFWGEMVKEKGFDLKKDYYNIKLDIVQQQRDLEGFKRLIEEMNNAGIPRNANRIITFYCENGLTTEANNAYFEFLGKKGCNLSPETFRTLVIQNCNVGRFEPAYNIFKKSPEQHMFLDFDTLKCLAEGLANQGLKRDAKDLISSLKKMSRPNLLEAWAQLADALGLSPVVSTRRRFGSFFDRS